VLRSGLVSNSIISLGFHTKEYTDKRIAWSGGKAIDDFISVSKEEERHVGSNGRFLKRVVERLNLGLSRY